MSRCPFHSPSFPLSTADLHCARPSSRLPQHAEAVEYMRSLISFFSPVSGMATYHHPDPGPLLPIEPVAAEAPATGQCSALHMCFSGHSAFTPHTAFDGILRSASPHLECCLCCYSSSRFSHFQSKKPPLLSSDLLRCTWSAAYAATPCPPLLPFFRQGIDTNLVICSYRISPLFYIFFILQFASLHLECCPLFIILSTRPHAPHCIS